MSTSDTRVPNSHSSKPFTGRQLLTFIIPSLIGVGLFLVPFRLGGAVNIGMGVLADALNALLSDWLPAIATFLLSVSLLLTLYVKALNPAWAQRGKAREMFHVGGIWVALRALGAMFVIMTFFQIGPEAVTAAHTGGVMLNDLAPVLLTFFFFAALLLPFLVEFGLMEFVGSLVQRPFRWLFNLPGRTAVDATASWMGANSVGVLITMQQYEQGFYNRREASIVATNFSVTSIAFSLVVANVMGINHLFIPFYLTVMLVSLIAAIIVPRLPPLSRKPSTYYEPVGCRLTEERRDNVGLLRHSLQLAVHRASTAPGPVALVKQGVGSVLDLFLTLLPLVFAIGTLGLILAEFTPVFTWLSYPIVPLLELLRIPEAQQAAPTMLVGFADMFLPAVLGASIESELTRFVIASVSLAQLIYMSEIGALLLKSKIPLSLWDLVIIFILRTLITLPIIALIAHVFVF